MTPDLEPYSDYQDSSVPWLGDIPAHWQQLPGRACFAEKKTPNAGMQETTVLSLSYGQIVVKPPEKLHGLVPASFETYQIIEPYDIVIRPTDLQNDWVSLRTGLARTRGIITSAYMRLRTKDLLAEEYGHLLLHAYDLKKVFYGLGSGLRQNLSWRDFKYLPCLVPPPDEQKAVARFLDYIDRRIRGYIRAQRKLIALLEEQKQAIIHRAVTQGLDPDVPLKPSGAEWLRDVPKHWEVKRLKFTVRLNPSRTETDKLGDETEVTFLPMERVNEWGQIDRTLTARLGAVRTGFTFMRDGDVMVAKITPCFENGKGAACTELANGIAFGSTEFHVLRPLRRMRARYLYYLTRDPVVRFLGTLSMRGAAGQRRVPTDFFANLFVPVPSPAEQEGIADWIESETQLLSLAIDRAHREIALLREYRIRLIADVVTGKLDVRQVAANLPGRTERLECREAVEDTAEAKEAAFQVN